MSGAVITDPYVGRLRRQGRLTASRADHAGVGLQIASPPRSWQYPLNATPGPPRSKRSAAAAGHRVSLDLCRGRSCGSGLFRFEPGAL